MSGDDPVAEIEETTRVHHIVTCPYCGETHRHGNATPLAIGDLGHRVKVGCGSYYIQRTAETEMWNEGEE
jgi:hypothetical protein